MEENKTTVKAVKTTAGDVGVKLLDIIAKPISILCEYAEEPIKIVESMRKINEEDDGKREINNEIRRAKAQSKIQQKDYKARENYERAQMNLKKEMAEAEAEIEAFKNEAKAKNQKDLLNTIEDYQSELSKSYVFMTESLLNTTVKFTKEMSQLIMNLNSRVSEMKEKESQNLYNKMKEIMETFKDDPFIKESLVNNLINQENFFVQQITEITAINNEQLRDLYKLSIEYAKNGGQTIKELLLPITGVETYNMLSVNSENALDVSDNGKKVIEAEAVEVE